MHEHHNPVLSAAAIRRILTLHSFSAENRAYLLKEAEIREERDVQLQALFRETGVPPVGAARATVVPARTTVETERTQLPL